MIRGESDLRDCLSRVATERGWRVAVREDEPIGADGHFVGFHTVPYDSTKQCAALLEDIGAQTERVRRAHPQWDLPRTGVRLDHRADRARLEMFILPAAGQRPSLWASIKTWFY